MTPDEPLFLFLAAVGLDLLVGDPQLRCHPVRLLGDLSRGVEWLLRRCRLHGHLGGLLHLLLLLALPLGLWWSGHRALVAWQPWAAWTWDLLLAASLLCQRDLLAHGIRVARALPDLDRARQRLAMLVGRDTAQLDAAAIRRATIESLAENLVDGVITPLLAFAVAGLPGLIAVKVVSTLDSMIGYRSERYRRFGMWAARLDDLLHWLPARASVLLLALVAPLLGLHGGSCLRAAWRWHGLLPSPNSGWPEAALAGALRCRLLGPIHSGGRLVNETWMGEADWPSDPGATGLRRALWLLALAILVTIAGAALLVRWQIPLGGAA